MNIARMVNENTRRIDDREAFEPLIVVRTNPLDGSLGEEIWHPMAYIARSDLESLNVSDEPLSDAQVAMIADAAADILLENPDIWYSLLIEASRRVLDEGAAQSET